VPSTKGASKVRKWFALLLGTTALSGLLGSAPAAAQPQHTAAATRVTVLAARPSEFRFKLSRAAVRKGVVLFRVVNRGALPHDFKIAGKKTKLLAPGKSQTLRVVFRKAKRYAYLCTVTGHAAAGMKGTLRVR
jgi:uncharacterized cupredoxin-like copper-binding protein